MPLFRISSFHPTKLKFHPIQKFHPTQKPYKLIERLVKCCSNEGDNVLDIFMGSGMTALVSKDLKRNFYGCEISEEYCNKNLLTDPSNNKNVKKKKNKKRKNKNTPKK